MSDSRLQMMSDSYDSEQSELKEKAAKLQSEIELQEKQADNLDKFIETIKLQKDDIELDGYNLYELVSGIYIENADVLNNPDEESQPHIDDIEDGEYVTFEYKSKSSKAKKISYP